MGPVGDPVQVRPAPTVRLVADGDPLAGAPVYVNPMSAAMRAAQSAVSDHFRGIYERLDALDSRAMMER